VTAVSAAAGAGPASKAPTAEPINTEDTENPVPTLEDLPEVRSDTGGRFIIRNSWGTAWGDKGFGYASEAYITAAFFNESYGISL